MIFKENETMELKEIVTEDIKKEIIAFANCDGGRLCIGVQDNGTIVGLDDPDGSSLQISNMVRDAIKPDVTMFVHYSTIEVEGKNIVIIDVQRGTDRPYYISKKGMRPEGVYVRQGYSAVPATDSAIRRMIKETDGDRFEEMRSLNQELTFQSLKKEFERRDVEFGAQQMRTLKLLDRDGLYSNLAMLLSDQCVLSIKAAIFQGTDQTVFRDRREFTGSLMQQMNDAYDFIDFRNQTQASIEKLTRIDRRDYPELAVREALMNLLIHRDYSFRASALISMYADRIEFVSVGGLVPGIELEDVMMGISVCRNQELANVFYRLHLIEAYGTGIRKILGAYRGTGKEPTIETTKNAFKIVLPNINAKYEAGYEEYKIEDAAELKEKPHMYVSCGDKTRANGVGEKRILEYAKKHGGITRSDVINLLDISASTANRLLRQLTDHRMLEVSGKARRTRYMIPEKIL